jgi:hypothetical protein
MALQIWKFFTNTDDTGAPVEGTPVEAPAFSLTKVLTAGAIIVTPIATAVTEFLAKGALQAVHYTALALGLMGLLAIAGSADVLARAISARRAEQPPDDQPENLIQFSPAVPAELILEGEDEDVSVVAAVGGSQVCFLIRREDDSLEWRPADEITFG